MAAGSGIPRFASRRSSQLKGHAAAITELGDHRRRGSVVLLRPHSLGFSCGEQLPTAVATQARSLSEVPALQCAPGFSVLSAGTLSQFPAPHSGHGSPRLSTSCRITIFCAPVKCRRRCVRWPFTSGSASAITCSGVTGFGGCCRTALFFSVVRGRTNLSAMACRAVLSFRPSDSLREHAEHHR